MSTLSNSCQNMIDNFCCALIPMLELFKSELVELVTDSFNNRVCKKSSKKSDF